MIIPGIIASRFTPQGDFESIATVTVGAGGVANVDFQSISSSYQHLQVRALILGSFTYMKINLNNDTGSNYAWHELFGDGGSAGAGASANTTFGLADQVSSGTSLRPGLFIMDLLDYKDTNKFKTMRTLSGFDNNGAGGVFLNSSLWRSTSAVNRITFTMNTGNIGQYSHIALYGIKG